MAIAIKNDKMVSTMSGHFVQSHGSSYGMSSALPMYLMLPRLAGLWPFSSFDQSNDMYDISGQGRTLTNNNTVDITGMHGIVPYANFIRANSESFSRPDEAGLSLTNGVALMCWCWFDAESTGNDAGLISKWQQTGVINKRSYTLYKTSTNVFRFMVSDNGTVEYTVDSTVTYSASQWFFVAAGLYPSTYQTICVNGVWVDDTTGIPVGIYDNDRPLYLGAHNEANYLDGRMTLTAIHKPPATIAHYKAVVNSVYQHTRALFGIRS